MIHSLVCLVLVLSVGCVVSGSTWTRMETGAARCKLPSTLDLSTKAYMDTEKSIIKSGISKDDVEGLFKFAEEQKQLWGKKNRFFAKDFAIDEFRPVLDMLTRVNTLKDTDCMDYCAFVMISNNCRVTRPLATCYPSMASWTHVSIMINSQLFPRIERCQVPLIERAISLNATIKPELQETITFLVNELTHFEPMNGWNSIEELMLKSDKPFQLTAYLIAPHKNDFYSKLMDVMLKLEAMKGEKKLQNAIAAKFIKHSDAEAHFNRLVLKPCQEYIDKMHTVMDPISFYGHIIDSDASKFNLPSLDDDKKLQFFQLYHLYDACNLFDNTNFKVGSKYRRIVKQEEERKSWPF